MAPKPFIDALIPKQWLLKNWVILTRHIKKVISKISKLQTMSTLRVSNSISNQHYLGICLSIRKGAQSVHNILKVQGVKFWFCMGMLSGTLDYKLYQSEVNLDFISNGVYSQNQVKEWIWKLLCLIDTERPNLVRPLLLPRFLVSSKYSKRKPVSVI